MKTELVVVTPAMARDWLKLNTENRPLRPGVVNALKGAHKRGEWMVTHQGIAFSAGGKLLDGQHRLTFISQLPEGSEVPVNVTRGLDPQAFMAIDQGARRTVSDVLGVSSGLAAVGALFARVYDTTKAGVSSVAFMEPLIRFAEPEYSELVTFSPTTCRTWSSAPVRAAAIVQMKRGHNSDFIKVQYDALIHKRFALMSPSAQSLMKQQMSGVILAARSMDLFVRALRVFDSAKPSVTRIQVNDQAAVLEEVRGFLARALTITRAAAVAPKESPAKAGRKVAEPVREFTGLEAA